MPPDRRPDAPSAPALPTESSGRAVPPSTVAAGLTSLRVTFEHARAQTGLGRALRVLGRVNQTHGFDCPGCAWPDPRSRSLAEFCENGAKAVLDEATTLRIGREFFGERSIDELAKESDRWLNAQGRLTEPLILRAGSRHYEPIDYEAALDLVAEHLAGLSEPDRAAFYTSGRTSNEAAFLYQLLARSLGTNNLPDCSNLCHESSGVALKETLGIGKGTVRLEDFASADLIFVIGQNPGTNHPRMLSTLREAKAAGATIVSVNPLRELGLVALRAPPACRRRARRRSRPRRRALARARQRRSGALSRPQQGARSRPARRTSEPSTKPSSASTRSDFDDFAQPLSKRAPGEKSKNGAASREVRSKRDRSDDARVEPRHLLAGPWDSRSISNAVATICGGRLPLAATGQRGTPRSRRVPGARPQQRARRPHRGHRLRNARRASTKASSALSTSAVHASQDSTRWAPSPQ